MNYRGSSESLKVCSGVAEYHKYNFGGVVSTKSECGKHFGSVSVTKAQAVSKFNAWGNYQNFKTNFANKTEKN